MAWGEPTGIPAYTRRGYERIQQIPLTDEEQASHDAAIAAWPTIQMASLQLANARSAIDESDMVALRCIKAGVAFPQNWQTYVQGLRAVIKAGGGPLPAIPTNPDGSIAYPQGT